ncbi:Ubox domain containing protein [Balamuthia mandrillaris]
MSSKEAAIASLLRNFGGQLDREVLESVLEICGGDARQATNFLRVQNEGDYVEPTGSSAQQGPSLPSGYMDRPKGFVMPKQDGESSGASQHRANRLKKIFLSETSFLEHQQLLQKEYPDYVAVLMLLLNKAVELSHNTKARVLAAAWAAHEWELAEFLLSFEQHYALPEVLKAVKILDAPRKLRALEKRIARLEKQGTAKARTIGVIKAQINDLKKDIPTVEEQQTSVTSALAKRVRKWAGSLQRAKLEFFLLQMPKELWQELADVVHFHPKDFQLEYFLDVVFGKQPPTESAVVQAAHLTEETSSHELVAKYRFPYSFLRKHLPELSNTIKVEVAKYETLDTLIWYYEEISGPPEVDSIIRQRLADGEEPHFSYGKLMERLMFFKQSGVPFFEQLIPIAERRLRSLTLPLEPPVVVCGDASYSMDVAIRTATIIGSLLTALTNADLTFFNVKLFRAPVMPRTVDEVLEVATTTKADGLTAPGCCIWEYYKKKEVVKFFVIVTDEIENEPFNGEFFGQLFYKYHQEVYPAKIVFVSFLENPTQKGRMVQSLENLGFNPLQFRLDSRRPDLTKVDTLLGILSSECEFFSTQAEALAESVLAGIDLAETEQAGERKQTSEDKEKGKEKQKETTEEVEKSAQKKGAAAVQKKKLALAIQRLEELPLPETLQQKKQQEAEKHKQGAKEGKDKDKEGEEDSGKKSSPRRRQQEDDGAPEEFCCPITNDVMEDPVVAADGQCYERSAIEEWLQKNDTSPLTGAKLETKVLYPNYSLRSRIKEWNADK